MLNSSASSTARLDGAPTAAISGIPAIAAFCTSSKLARPLSNNILSCSGSQLFCSAAPISLSNALCRPTSSLNNSNSPFLLNKAEACKPPVLSKAACCERRISGKPYRISASTANSPSCVANTLTVRIALIEPFPHTPQLDVV